MKITKTFSSYLEKNDMDHSCFLSFLVQDFENLEAPDEDDFNK